MGYKQLKERVALKKLTGSTLADLLVIFGIAVIPLMYGGLLTSAYQDPTNRIDTIHAAVVNEDTPAKVTLISGEVEEFALGDELTDTLTNPPPEEEVGFTWEAMTAEEAAKALGDQKVRAVLTIPEGFTERATLVGTDRAIEALPQTLELVTDDGVNYISGTLAQTVATALQGRITSEGADIYTDNILLSLRDIRSGMEEAADGSAQLEDGAHALSEGLVELHAGAGGAAAGSIEISEGARDLSAGVDAAAAGGNALSDGTGALSAGAAELSGGLNTFAAGVNEMRTQVGASNTPAGSSQRTLVAGAADLAAGANTLNEAVHVVDFGAIKAEVDTVHDDLEQRFHTAREAIHEACHELALEDLHLCEDLLAHLDPLADELEAGANAIHGKADLVFDDLVQLQAGTAELAVGASQLEEGARQVAGGLETMTGPDALPALQKGARELAGGAQAANAGAHDLSSGLGQLQAGSGALSEGTATLASGLGDLDEGAGDAAEGGAALSEGAHELATAIADGAEQIPNYTEEDDAKIASLIAEPVKVDPVRQHAVANNGAGFTPMFMSLSLWIGGIAIFLVIPALSRKPGSNAPWWMAAVRPALIGAAFGVVQAVLLTVVTDYSVGLHAANLGGLVGIALASSFTFIAINQALIATLGYRGRFVSILLLCLQIASMGATFPIETTPKFFQWINPFLPMSYTQLAIRQMIAGEGATNAVPAALLILAVYFLVAMVLIFYGAWTKKGAHPLPEDNALLQDYLAREETLDKAAAATAEREASGQSLVG